MGQRVEGWHPRIIDITVIPVIAAALIWPEVQGRIDDPSGKNSGNSVKISDVEETRCFEIQGGKLGDEIPQEVLGQAAIDLPDYACITVEDRRARYK